MAAGLLFFSSTAAAADKAQRAAEKKRARLSQKGEKLPETYTVYVGTYTGQDSKGIYVCRFNSRTGEITEAEVAAEVKNPSFLAIHPNRRFLYAVTESGDFDGKNTGAVSAFSIDPESKKLTLLNHQPSEGAGPCYLVVDAKGKNVLVANYGGGSIACLPVGKDGRLGKASSAIQHKGSSVNPSRQEGPHAHSINLDPANRYAFAADLGLDKILIYRFDGERGRLEPNDPPSVSVDPGAGPRHFAFHPSGSYAYVINEIGNTVTAFAYDSAHGVLKPLQTISNLPPDFKEVSYTAEVVVHPSGKFLYGSNRGHDSIAVFEIDQKTGKLKFVKTVPTGGKTPRNFYVDPRGQYLLAENMDSGNVAILKIDQKSGDLSPTGHELRVPSPCCIRMMPD